MRPDFLNSFPARRGWPPSLMATASLTRAVQSSLTDGSRWWMRNNEPGSDPYIEVHLVGPIDAKGTVLVQDENDNETRVPARLLEGLLYPMNLDQQPETSLLAHLSEAALLANLLTRDGLTLPYTTTGNVLTSLNPCKRVPELYNIGTMKRYVGARPAACPPHLYAVAEQAYRNLSRDGASQAIVVSGVSGAGKTEANKHIMQYLCWRAGQQLVSAAKLSPVASAEPHGSVVEQVTRPPGVLRVSARAWLPRLLGACQVALGSSTLPMGKAGPLDAQPLPRPSSGVPPLASRAPPLDHRRPELQLSEVSRCVLQSSIVFEARTALALRVLCTCSAHALHTHTLHALSCTRTIVPRSAPHISTACPSHIRRRPLATHARLTTTKRRASASSCACSSSRMGRLPGLSSTPTYSRSRASSRSARVSRPNHELLKPLHPLAFPCTSSYTLLQASAPSTSSTSYSPTTSCVPSSTCSPTCGRRRRRRRRRWRSPSSLR